jgi:hypothetical protein
VDIDVGYMGHVGAGEKDPDGWTDGRSSVEVA